MLYSGRASAVHAVRDSEVATMPAMLLHELKRRYPQVTTHLMMLMTQHMLNSLSQSDSTVKIKNLSTVAIVPISPDVPVTNFATQLAAALGSSVHSVLHLNHKTMAKQFNRDPNLLREGQQVAATNWLAEQEEKHDIVLYEAQYGATSWTHRCLRQADCIILVGVAGSDPSVSELEIELNAVATRAQKEFVLLHPIDTVVWRVFFYVKNGA
jgi:lysophospholipid hydrolase